MLPDSTACDAISSDDVCTVTCRPPAVGYPNVNPFNVTVNADEDGIAAPAVVMTTEVAVVALHVTFKPATLLPPAATMGVTDGAKKPEGYISVTVLLAESARCHRERAREGSDTCDADSFMCCHKRQGIEMLGCRVSFG